MKILNEFNNGKRDCVVISKEDFNYWENVLELMDNIQKDTLEIRTMLNQLTERRNGNE